MDKLIWICMIILTMIVVFVVLYCCVKVAGEADRKLEEMREIHQKDHLKGKK